MLCGDFNIQVEVQENLNAESLLDLIDSLGLVQHVHFETRERTYTGSNYNQKKWTVSLKTHQFQVLFLSDNATVLFNLKGSKSASTAKEVWFRKIKSINLPKFKNDLRTSELLLNTSKQIVDLVNCFNTT